MKRQRYFKLAGLFTVLTSVAGFWWACDFERVGPKEPSALKLTEILAELENSRTQAQAETAIQHLLEKTGIGIAVKGSKYDDYVLSDLFVPRLAQKHLLYLQSGDSLTWGKMFEIEKIVSESDWVRPVEFPEAMALLHEQALAAQSDPENPNHALLMALVTKDATLPASIAVPEEAGFISPVQEFLFEVWASYEFGEFQTEPKSAASGIVVFNFTFVECNGKKVKKVIHLRHEEPYSSSDQKKCLKKAKHEYKDEVEDCFDDHDKNCPKLQECLEEAHEEVLEDIDDCHDQGKGK